MRMLLARVLMALTKRSLGQHRRDWALAMHAEFIVATEAGEPLRFATDCLLGAWREMIAHEEGRFALAAHLLAVGFIVPIAALLLFSAAQGSPYLVLHAIGAGAIFGDGKPEFPITYANQAGLPLLTLLTIILGFGHLCMAWAILDRDWPRVGAIGRIGAAIMATMVAFTGILFLYDPCALPQAAVIVVELAAIWSLVCWHAEIPIVTPIPRWLHPD